MGGDGRGSHCGFLARGRLGVCERKAQVMDRKVECLGRILTEDFGCIGPERVQGDSEEPLPRAEGGL